MSVGYIKTQALLERHKVMNLGYPANKLYGHCKCQEI